jgi:hypothetical protein
MKKTKGTASAPKADKVIEAFGAREGTNRAKLLARLARDIGRSVPVTALAKAVYGTSDAPRAPLMMVMKGALATVADKKPGYKIIKSGKGRETAFRLSAAR